MPNRTVIPILILGMAAALSGSGATLNPVQSHGAKRQRVPPATGDTIPSPATGDKISHRPMVTNDKMAIHNSPSVMVRSRQPSADEGKKPGDKKGGQDKTQPPSQ
jgi:hypothetical protein